MISTKQKDSKVQAGRNETPIKAPLFIKIHSELAPYEKLKIETDEYKESMRNAKNYLYMEVFTKNYRKKIAEIFSFGDNALKTSILKRINNVSPCYLNCKKQCGYSFPDLTEAGVYPDADLEDLKAFLKARFPGGIKKKYVWCIHTIYGRSIAGTSRKKTTGLDGNSYTNAVSELKNLKDKHNQV